MKKILEVPYYSQKLDVVDEKWKDKACGVTSLKMVFEYYLRNTKDVPTINDLIGEGIFIGGYSKHGWIHDALVILARNHGLDAYRQEFKSHTIDLIKKIFRTSIFEEELLKKGVNKIIKKIEMENPVIVSVRGRFKKDGEFHMIVINGIEKDRDITKGFYYHEPNSDNKEDGMSNFVDIETFKKYWRKMAIFVYK